MATKAPPKQKLRPTDVARQLGCSVGYASQLINGVRPLTVATALKIATLTGHKFGPIANATDEEVSLLRKFAETAG